MKDLVDLNSISDGHLYTISDIVAIDTEGCKGCSQCCNGVGEMVQLTPYDIYSIKNKCEMAFDELLETYCTLRLQGKLKLPYLAMDSTTSRCAFLNDEDRCSIHSARPNICRLFPLGRVYEQDTYHYFVQKDACPSPIKKNISIEKWIGLSNDHLHQQFLLTWHQILKALQFKLKFVHDESDLSTIQTQFLDAFYHLIEAHDDLAFYQTFFTELPDIKRNLGIL